jgi:hypothetical protein
LLRKQPRQLVLHGIGDLMAIPSWKAVEHEFIYTEFYIHNGPTLALGLQPSSRSDPVGLLDSRHLVVTGAYDHPNSDVVYIALKT